ncbi:MAG: hypothetical protein ABIP63_01245 [Thermoanaerobaculia bacterium]
MVPKRGRQILRTALVWLFASFLAAGSVTAASDLDFYERLLGRGISHFAEGSYAAATGELRIAAFGLGDVIDEFETAHVYLALTATRLKDAPAARASVMRVLSAQRIQSRYPSLSIPIALRQEFDRIAAGMLTPAQLADLQRPATSAVVPPRIGVIDPPRPSPVPAPIPPPEIATPSPKTAPKTSPIPVPAPIRPPESATPAPKTEPKTAPIPVPAPIQPPEIATPAPKTAPIPVPAPIQPPEIATPAPKTAPKASPVPAPQPPPKSSPSMPAPSTRPAPQPVRPSETQAPAAIPQPRTEPPAPAPRFVVPFPAPQPSPRPVRPPEPPPVQPSPAVRPSTPPVSKAPASSVSSPRPPIDLRTALAEGQRALDDGDLAQARERYQSALEAASLTHEEALRIGEGLYRTKDFAGAVRAFRRAGSFARSEAQSQYANAVSLYEAGRYREAKRALADALPYLEMTPDVARYRAKIEGSVN